LVPGDHVDRGERAPDRSNDGLMTVEAVQYLMKNVHQLDLAFRLAENQSIVLLHGGGVDAPDWPLPVSLADPTDDVYDGTGRGTWSVTRDCRTPSRPRACAKEVAAASATAAAEVERHLVKH
jgi:hypothetical protein